MSECVGAVEWKWFGIGHNSMLCVISLDTALCVAQSQREKCPTKKIRRKKSRNKIRKNWHLPFNLANCNTPLSSWTGTLLIKFTIEFCDSWKSILEKILSINDWVHSTIKLLWNLYKNRYFWDVLGKCLAIEKWLYNRMTPTKLLYIQGKAEESMTFTGPTIALIKIDFSKNICAPICLKPYSCQMVCVCSQKSVWHALFMNTIVTDDFTFICSPY